LRTFLLIVLILAVLAGGIVGYLVWTTPKASEGIRLPLTASERTLLGYVPRDAEIFAIIPTATIAYEKMLRNPVARQPIEDWTSKHSMPSAWMLGGADLVLWKSGEQTSYAIRVDPVRAALVHLYLMVAGESEGTTGSFRINTAAAEGLEAQDVAQLETLSKGLPAGDLLIGQLSTGRGSFPPMPRPVITTASMTPEEILVTAHSAAADETTASQPVSNSFPRGAMLSAWFAKPPRPVDDLNRLLGARISPLVSDGVQVVLYDIQTRTLLPRPKGIFVVPDDEQRRQAVAGITGLAPQELREALGVKIQTLSKDGHLLVAFDDTSLPAFAAESFDSARWPANRWAVRIDPRLLVPLLGKLDNSAGLRIAAPRLFRSVRDLKGWIGYLGEASAIEAADSAAENLEELRVLIHSK
jgi:hypothetical protein